MKMHNTLHTPVLAAPILENLKKYNCLHILDATFGAGSLTQHILNHIPQSTIVATDRDPDAIAIATGMQTSFPQRLFPYLSKFSNLATILPSEEFHAAILDCGVSSPQIDRQERGFSFQKDGPLDMRMSQEGLAAAEIVNTFTAEALSKIFKDFGEERFARKIANLIVRRRQSQPFTHTADLASCIQKHMPYQKIHPATRVFQALRIVVNNEIEEIKLGLENSLSKLKDNGLIFVITFHSLEHKAAKSTLEKYFNKPTPTSRYQAPKPHSYPHPFQLTYLKSCLKPSDQEVRENPRARSAQMRICQKTVLKGA